MLTNKSRLFGKKSSQKQGVLRSDSENTHFSSSNQVARTIH